MKNSIPLVNGFVSTVYENGYVLKADERVNYLIPDYCKEHNGTWSTRCFESEVNVDLLFDTANLWRNANPEFPVGLPGFLEDDKWNQSVLDFANKWGCFQGSEQKRPALTSWKMKKKSYMALDTIYYLSRGTELAIKRWMDVEDFNFSAEDELDLKKWGFNPLDMKVDKIDGDWVLKYKPTMLMTAVTTELLLWIMNDRMNTGQCDQCENFFYMSRSDARFCSTNCRVKSNRQNKKEEEIPTY